MRSFPTPTQRSRRKNADTLGSLNSPMGKGVHNGRGGNASRCDPRRADRTTRNRPKSPGVSGETSAPGVRFIPLLTNAWVRHSSERLPHFSVSATAGSYIGSVLKNRVRPFLVVKILVSYEYI